jgi:hypothetical protein
MTSTDLLTQTRGAGLLAFDRLSLHLHNLEMPHPSNPAHALPTSVACIACKRNSPQFTLPEFKATGDDGQCPNPRARAQNPQKPTPQILPKDGDRDGGEPERGRAEVGAVPGNDDDDEQGREWKRSERIDKLGK